MSRIRFARPLQACFGTICWHSCQCNVRSKAVLAAYLSTQQKEQSSRWWLLVALAASAAAGCAAAGTPDSGQAVVAAAAAVAAAAGGPVAAAAVQPHPVPCLLHKQITSVSNIRTL